MKIKYFFILYIFITSYSFSQVGIGTTNPDPSSSLDINSTTSGLLIPRVVLFDISDNLNPINSPATSLLIYNTNPFVFGGSGEGYYYWSGSYWVKIFDSNSTITQNWIRNFSGNMYPTNLSDNIGINTSTPTSKLDVNGQITIDQKNFGGYGGLLIKGDAPGNNYPNITFSTLNDSGNDEISAYIGGNINDNTTGNESMDLSFLTSTNGLGGLSEKMRIKDNGNIGIGNTNPSYILDISNRMKIRSGGSIFNSSGLWLNNSINTYEASFIGMDQFENVGFYGNTGAGWGFIMNNNNGNIGIGNQNPNAPLQFGNTITNRKIVLYEGANNDHQYYGFGINGGTLRYQTNTLSDDHVFFAGVNATTSNELMRVKGNGNVGIGISNPSSKTEISGNGLTELKLSSTLGFGATRFSMISDRGLASEWRPAYIEDADNGGFTGRLDFYTNGTGGGNLFGSVRAMSIVNGKIGIGTTLPNAPLQFSNSIGNRKIVLYDTNNNDNQFYGFGLNGGILRYQTDALGADHVFYAGINSTSSSELMRIKGIGNVGIGTPNPLQRLDVQGGNARINNAFIGDLGHGTTWTGFSHYNQANTTGYGFLHSSDGNYTLINKQNTGAGYIGFRIANTDQAVITNAGNMGIGTTTPAQKLDIIGKIKVTDGTQGSGKILTSDGAGTSTWSNLGSVMQSWQTVNPFTGPGDYNPIDVSTGFTEISSITTVVSVPVKTKLMISAVVNMYAWQFASAIGGWGEIRLELDGNPLSGTNIRLYNLNDTYSTGTYANYMVDVNPGSYTLRIVGRSTGAGITVDFNGKYMSILGMPIN